MRTPTDLDQLERDALDAAFTAEVGILFSVLADGLATDTPEAEERYRRGRRLVLEARRVALAAMEEG